MNTFIKIAVLILLLSYLCYPSYTASSEDSPMAAWMISNIQTPYENNDLKKLSKNMRMLSKLSPDPLWNSSHDTSWENFAIRGELAADHADPIELRESCKSCHSTWRKKYRQHYSKRQLINIQ